MEHYSEVNILNQYLNEISQYPLLTKDQEKQLATTVQLGLAASQNLQHLIGDGSAMGFGEGYGSPTPDHLETETERSLLQQINEGRAAKELFVNSNLRLVVSVARKYTRNNTNLEMLDHIQAGNEGLMHAVDKFDPRRDFRFSTYAGYWIRRGITNSKTDTEHAIRKPRHAAYAKMALDKAAAELMADGRGPVSDADLLAVAGLRNIEQIKTLRESSQRVESLDHAIGEEGVSTLADILADPDSVDPADAVVQLLNNQRLQQALIRLDDINPYLRLVIEATFGLDGSKPMTLIQTGECISRSKQHVHRIQERALRLLRDELDQYEF